MTLALFGLLFIFAFPQSDAAWAASFSVNPVQIFLSSETPSALLTLHNESKETLRFQLSAFGWDQSQKGEIQLQPTQDIIVFPLLLSLAPGEERKVRVGTAVPIAPKEKSYRIFVGELPSQVKAEGGQVTIVTEVGIPIFLRPDKAVMEGSIQELAIRKRRLSFQVKNTGNVHFVVGAVRVKGAGRADEPLLTRQMEGWYILAGGSRAYEIELSKEDCPRIKTLTVEVETSQTTHKEQMVMPPDACTP